MRHMGNLSFLYLAILGILLSLCSVKGNYCEVNLCHNGGTCVTGVGDDPFICICSDGFAGDTCNLTETGPCSPNPCRNDGSCEVISPTRRGDVFGGYLCRCQPGFDGAHCQINVNDCADQPCKNKGVCRDLEGDYTCQCPSPYVGKQCQMALLGMEGGGIVESQISASSIHYSVMGLQRWGPDLARLNNQGIVFVGNIDNESTKANLFEPPIVAQYIRVIPMVCRKACTLRMELVGCELNVYSNTTGCSEPMGMKSRLISDGQLTSSSAYRTWGIDSFTWQPQFARLDKQGKTNAWAAATNNRSEWLQVDLEKTKHLTGIITQGAKDFGVMQFVSMFKVAYSDDGLSWSTVFQGNVDNNSHKKNLFEPAFYGRYVRVMPWEWH
ncbi:hypothetical protein CRUP_008010, partial [Coryphaenoides rupestris]